MSQDHSEDAGLSRTSDPAIVQAIVEKRGGYPAHEPESTGQGDRALLRIGDHDADEDLEEMTWETFLDAFEEKGLAYVYDPHDEGVGELRARDD
jgi:hypothetical protein